MFRQDYICLLVSYEGLLIASRCGPYLIQIKFYLANAQSSPNKVLTPRAVAASQLEFPRHL